MFVSHSEGFCSVLPQPTGLNVTHTHVNNPSMSVCVRDTEREVGETPALKALHLVQLWAGQQLTQGCGSLFSFCFLHQQPCLLVFNGSMKQTCNFHSCVSGAVPG